MSEREEYLGDGLYASFDGLSDPVAGAGSASIMKSFSTKRRCRLSSGLSMHCRNESEKTPPRAKNRHGPSLAGGLFFCAHDREAADAIQIDRIEFIASPSFDIRIGF